MVRLKNAGPYWIKEKSRAVQNANLGSGKGLEKQIHMLQKKKNHAFWKFWDCILVPETRYNFYIISVIYVTPQRSRAFVALFAVLWSSTSIPRDFSRVI